MSICVITHGQCQCQPEEGVSCPAADDLIKALSFYANPDNYWNDPLSLDERWDRPTLEACHESKKGNIVGMDNGETARNALIGKN